MKQLRTIGVFALACSAICFIIAIERYYSAVKTAEEVAERMGLELESIGTPTESLVSGFASVLLLIIGTRLVFESIQKPKDAELI
jgi:putative Mn2+ efflux pump MntP